MILFTLRIAVMTVVVESLWFCHSRSFAVKLASKLSFDILRKYRPIDTILIGRSRNSIFLIHLSVELLQQSTRKQLEKNLMTKIRGNRSEHKTQITRPHIAINSTASSTELMTSSMIIVMQQRYGALMPSIEALFIDTKPVTRFDLIFASRIRIVVIIVIAITF